MMLVLIYVALGLGCLAGILDHKTTRVEFRSQPIADQIFYVLIVVLTWPWFLFEE